MDKKYIFLLVFFLGPWLCSGELHRARGTKSKFSSLSLRPSWPPGPERVGPPPSLENSLQPDDPEPIYLEPAPPPLKRYIEFGQGVQPPTEDHDANYPRGDPWEVAPSSPDKAPAKERHTSQQWILSLLSAMLVGLSGIFPLVVIPLETGEALRHGAAAAKLRLLLSFAVGGLLGDVFLHLLPEAWAHLSVGDHEGHMWIGLWVILGLLGFLLLEKLFPDGEKEEEEDEEEEEEEGEQIGDQDTLAADSVDSSALTPWLFKSLQNGHVTCNGIKDREWTNRGITAEGVKKRHEAKRKKDGKAEAKHHIKTSGWLNLMANVIDNFTHGLAVAGSYCVSVKVGLITTLAVLLHEVPHEVGDFAILLRSGFDRWQAAKAQLLTATGGLFGAACALLADSAEAAGDRTAWVLPFTSGGFIYIALVSVVPDLLKETSFKESVKQVLLLCTGIGVMLLVTIIFE